MPAGRPTKYEGKKTCKQVYKLLLLGATDEQIADFLEVALSTLNLWKQDNDEFSEVFRTGKLGADSNVAKSLYKRATGFKYEERTFENTVVTTIDQAGKLAQTPGVLVKRVKKLVPADVGAQKMWLVNRQKALWRDKVDVEQKNLNLNMNVEPTPEEAAKIKEALDKSI